MKVLNSEQTGMFDFLCDIDQISTFPLDPVGSPSHGEDVTVYVKDINQPSLPTPFYYGLFNCISFHKFSRHLSVFSLCSSGLISALFVLVSL